MIRRCRRDSLVLPTGSRASSSTPSTTCTGPTSPCPSALACSLASCRARLAKNGGPHSGVHTTRPPRQPRRRVTRQVASPPRQPQELGTRHRQLHPVGAQHLDSPTVALGDHTQQDMLRPEVAVAEPLGLVQGKVEDQMSLLREPLEHLALPPEPSVASFFAAIAYGTATRSSADTASCSLAAIACHDQPLARAFSTCKASSTSTSPAGPPPRPAPPLGPGCWSPPPPGSPRWRPPHP